MLLTFLTVAQYHAVKSIRRLEQHLDMPDETLGNQDAVDVRSVAHVQEHVGNAGSRRLLKGREDAPNPIDFFLHALLLVTDELPFGRVIGLWSSGEDVRSLSQADVPKLVYHVALRVPVLVLPVSENLDKLLQDGCLAAVALLGMLR